MKLLKGIPNNKSLVNDALTNEFYEAFWDKLKDSFINSIKLAYQKKVLIMCQRQAVIKLVEKKIVIKHCLRIGDQFPYLM